MGNEAAQDSIVRVTHGLAGSYVWYLWRLGHESAVTSVVLLGAIPVPPHLCVLSVLNLLFFVYFVMLEVETLAWLYLRQGPCHTPPRL